MRRLDLEFCRRLVASHPPGPPPESRSQMTIHRSNFADRLKEFPDHAFADAGIFRHRGNWRDYFRRRAGLGFDGRVILEVGSFDAAFLCDIAERHPQTAFIGLDWKFKATYVGAERIAARSLRNVALLRGRAQDLRHVFADGEIDEVWVFHPEPCDEPNQAQNRLIAAPFLADVHAVLRDDASTLSLKTDHPGYYQWVLGLLRLPEPAHFAAAREGAVTSPRVRPRDLLPVAETPAADPAITDRFVVAATSANYWHDPAVLAHTAGRAFTDQPTTYERRFLRKRQPIYYIELRKKPSLAV